VTNQGTTTLALSSLLKDTSTNEQFASLSERIDKLNDSIQTNQDINARQENSTQHLSSNDELHDELTQELPGPSTR
jgi:uncharacterized protein YdcH (DUF465 family)